MLRSSNAAVLAVKLACSLEMMVTRGSDRQAKIHTAAQVGFSPEASQITDSCLLLFDELQAAVLGVFSCTFDLGACCYCCW